MSEWPLTDVIISNLRPKLPVHLDIDIRLQIFLNCAMALKYGIEIGGFWADNIRINEVSGEKIYASYFRPWNGRFVAFTLRIVKSGEMCGFLLRNTYFGIDVSIVNGLDKRHFKEESFFKHLLPE